MTEFSYHDRPEQTVRIDLPHTGGLWMKGILRGDYTQPIALLVHGRPGNGNELLPYLYARSLSEIGIASLRLFLYDFLPGTRNLLQTSLDDNAADIAAAAEYVRGKGAETVFGVGHSYGGLALLRSDVRLDAAVLWDPTHGSVYHRKSPLADVETHYGEFTEQEYGDLLVTVTGPGDVISKAIRDHDKQLGDTTAWAAGKGYPLKVISVEHGLMTDLGAQYAAAADEPKEHVVIPSTHHAFEDSDAVTLQLFDETNSWLQKYSS